MPPSLAITSDQEPPCTLTLRVRNLVKKDPSMRPTVAVLPIGSPVGFIDPVIDSAVQDLINDGIPVVVAAGNENGDACKASPSGVRDAVAVARMLPENIRYWAEVPELSSNYGPCVDVYAPGLFVYGAWNAGDKSFITERSGARARRPRTSAASLRSCWRRSRA